MCRMLLVPIPFHTFLRRKKSYLEYYENNFGLGMAKSINHPIVRLNIRIMTYLSDFHSFLLYKARLGPNKTSF